MKTTSEPRTLTCTYIDTCYPDFLQDHHNRDNELLLCASANQSYSDMQEELVQSAFYSDKIPSDITDDQIIEAVDKEFRGYFSHHILDTEDIYSNEVQVYAYLNW